MITNQEKLISTISKWLEDYIKSNNIKNLIVPFDNTIRSIVTSYFCEKIRFPTLYITSDNSTYLDRNNLKYIRLNLKEIVQNLVSECNVLIYPGDATKEIWAATYKCFAKSHQGLIVGSFSRNQYNLPRDYLKNSVDMAPIANLYDSEIKELFDNLVVNGEDVVPLPYIEGLSLEQIEWADRLNEKEGIISGSKDPAKSSDFYRFLPNQQKIICKLHQIEKATRHKINTNVCIPPIRRNGMVE